MNNTVVRFKNITEEDFSHAYGGVPYSVKAGESIMLPYDLGAHLAKHLARKLLLAGDKSPTVFDPKDPTQGNGAPVWGPEDEARLISKILGTSYEQPEVVEKSEAEKLQERVAELNRFNRETEVAEATTAPVDPDGTDPQNVIEGVLNFKTKADVIEELRKRNIQFDARASKAKLEALLVAGPTT